MATTVDLFRIAGSLADLTHSERQRLGRILVHEYAQDASDLLDGIQLGFLELEQELKL